MSFPSGYFCLLAVAFRVSVADKSYAYHAFLNYIIILKIRPDFVDEKETVCDRPADRPAPNQTIHSKIYCKNFEKDVDIWKMIWYYNSRPVRGAADRPTKIRLDHCHRTLKIKD